MQKRAAAGREGGKASGRSRKQKQANEANASISKQNEANVQRAKQNEANEADNVDVDKDKDVDVNDNVDDECIKQPKVAEERTRILCHPLWMKSRHTARNAITAFLRSVL